MRVAVLWPEMSGYFDACLRALNATGTEIYLAHRSAQPTAPFDDATFDWVDQRLVWRDEADVPTLLAALDDFAPDAILVGSWHRPFYRAVLRRWRGRAVRVLCMDNQWLARPKQWLGRASARWYVQPMFDAVWLPGERQTRFARMLGFREEQIWRGLYVADRDAFDRGEPDLHGRDGAFLFVGRLVEEKGVRDLSSAYQEYLKRCDGTGKRAWPLHVGGTGELAHLFANESRARLLGFVQPGDLPGVMQAATTLLLPSLFEPWGVVMHEATSAGLPLISSTRVGATAHLLQDGYNGWVVPPGSPRHLADRMWKMSALSDDRLAAMGRASHELSRQFTPQRWADYLLDRLESVEGRATPT